VKRLLAILLMALAPLCALAQGSNAMGAEYFAPPKCPGLTKASHPSTADIERTQSLNSQVDSILPSDEPLPNFGVERYRLRDYADCTSSVGCYWADLAAQIRRASALMDEAAKAQPHGTKMAVVLDIDETSLTNYCEEVREDFGYIADHYDAWTVSPASAMPIQWTVDLAKKAQQLGADVFFITGRPEAQRSATEANLKAAGYSGWKGLLLKQSGVAYTSTSSYKSGERQKIVDSGYTLLLNMGDQWSDLQWPPLALHNVKLPNPFYYLP
jgi:hypothetical protein